MLSRALIPTALGATLLGSIAPAEAAPCSASRDDLAWVGTDLAEIGGDTGWFPASLPAQLRLVGRVVGETAVSATSSSQLCWTESMQGTIDAQRGSGWLDVAYGADLHIYAKIDTSILGKRIYWEGEIPIPYIPKDLLLSGAIAFDPTLDDNVDARVADGTAPITLVSTDVIGSLIDIIGISGGVRVTVTPAMVASYRTTVAHLGSTSATSGTQTVALPRPAAGYDAALELPVSFDGVVRYEPTLTFGARLYVSILGYKVVDYELVQIPMTLPALDRPITLTAETPARFALPVLDGIGEGARMDFASGPTQALAIANRGELALTLAPTELPSGVTVAPVTLSPGATGELAVTIADGALATSQTLRLTTTDPDHPMLEIELGLDVGGTDPGMVDEPTGAGGCSTSGPPSLAIGLALLALLRRCRG